MEIQESLKYIVPIITAGVSAYGAYRALESQIREKFKGYDEKFTGMKNDIDKLENNLQTISHQVAELNTSHRLNTKQMEEFRKEQKEENKMVRDVLTKNTAAILSLENLLKRLENKL
jgi:chromosome segregation ATPase